MKAVVKVVMVKKSAEVFRGRRLKLELELGLSPLPSGSHFFKPSRAPSITTTLSLQHIVVLLPYTPAFSSHLHDTTTTSVSF